MRDKVDKYVLPMIQRHFDEQRNRLSRHGGARNPWHRFTSVGRNLYLTGSLARGTALILRAMGWAIMCKENLWYLAAASPPARTAEETRWSSEQQAAER